MTNAALLGTFGDVGGGPLMFRNKIINGDMRIDQRNLGAAVGANLYPVDRFSNQVTYGTLSFQQRSITSTDSNYESGSAPDGFKNSVKISVTTSNSSPATTDRNTFQTNVEGLNHSDLNWGTASAKPITISFWCKASVAGVYSLAIQNYANDLSYCSTFTISSANTWEYKTIVVPGPTSGSWPTTSTSAITVRFGLGMGSLRVATSNNTWLSGDYRQATGALQFTGQANGSTLYLTGVQFEAGSVATPFEQRPVGMELSLCQRYYEQIGEPGGADLVLGGVATAGSQTAYYCFSYKVTKRTSVSPVKNGTWTVANSTQPIIGNWTATGFRAYATSLAAGLFYTHNDVTQCNFSVSAEL